MTQNRQHLTEKTFTKSDYTFQKICLSDKV